MHTPPDDQISDRLHTGGAQPPVNAARVTRRPTILVVDDNLGDFELLREASSEIRFDAEYEHLVDGRQAVLHLERTHRQGGVLPDLIVLDFHLTSAMNGVWVVDQVRKDDRFKASQILMYSSSPLDDLTQQALAERGISFVVKPTLFADYLLLMSILRKLILDQDATAVSPGIVGTRPPVRAPGS